MTPWIFLVTLLTFNTDVIKVLGLVRKQGYGIQIQDYDNRAPP